MSNRRDVLRATAVFLVSLGILLIFYGWVISIPFDAETIHRLIRPLHFSSRARTLGWVLGESLEWDITRQLYSLSFLMDYGIWGTDARGYHITDLVLTAVCALLAWRLFSSRFGIEIAAIAIALWLAHAAQGFSMLVFTGRNDRVMFIFFLAALLLMDRGMERRDCRMLFLSLAAMAVGAFAKESILSLVPVLFLWAALVSAASPAKALAGFRWFWVGLVALCLAYLLIRATAGIGTPDGVTLAGPRTWLEGTGKLYSLLLPRLHHLPNAVVGAIGIPTLIGITLWPALPSSARFGAGAVLFSLLPLPLFWTQPSFCWIPALWGALTASAVLVRLRHRFKVAAPFAVVAVAFLTLLVGLWGRSRSLVLAQRYQIFSAAVEVAVQEEPGIWSLEEPLRRYPALQSWIYDVEDRSGLKACAYVRDLISIRYGVLNPVLVGRDGEILQCEPPWRPLRM